MKTMFVITGLGVGGAERMLQKVVPNLKEDCFVVSLMNKDEVGKEIEDEGIDVYYLGLWNSLLNFPAVLWRFRKIIKKEEPELAYSFLKHSHIFSRIFSRMFGVEKIYCSIRLKHNNAPFMNFIDWLTEGLVDKYLPNSPALVPFLKEHQHIPEEKIQVLPNGIELDKFDIKVSKTKKKKSLGLEKDEFVISCVGRLHPQKDQKTLIRAVGEMPAEPTLLLIGDGEWRKELEEYAEARADGMVEFLGSRSDVPELLAVTDVFVLPSLREGMSNAVLEAMASGVCCIVSDIEENRALMSDGKTGLTFQTGDWKDLKAKLMKVYEDDKLRKKLGKKAKKEVEKNYDIKKIIKEYDKVLE